MVEHHFRDDYINVNHRCKGHMAYKNPQSPGRLRVCARACG